MSARHSVLAVLATVVILSFLACSSTTVTGSWKNPDFAGEVRKVYIVGISKQELHRRIFEDEFGRQLQNQGLTGIASYMDLAEPQNATKELIAERVRKNGADSVLMTRLVGQRTEEVVTPGRVSSYGAWPRYGRLYSPAPYYRNWGSYYDRCCEVLYEPPTITQYQVATIEANLYEARSGALIWSAQLETVVESNLQKLISDFATTVTEELRRQGLL
jgi:hypothetical protein